MEIKHRIQLPQLVKELGLPSIGVEIGVAEGFSSRDFLENGLHKLYSVDAWRTLNQSGDGGQVQEWHDRNYESAVKLLAPFKERSVILRGLSSDMIKDVPDNSIGLLYLDGDHSYEGVKRDLTEWYPKVVSGGIIAGHDYEMKQYGVKQAVHEFAKSEVFLIPEHKSEDAGFYFLKP
jgi:hypothetical protein